MTTTSRREVKEYPLKCGHSALLRAAPRLEEQLWCDRHQDWFGQLLAEIRPPEPPIRVGRRTTDPKRKKKYAVKLDLATAQEVREKYTWANREAAAVYYGVSVRTIEFILKGKIWKG